MEAISILSLCAGILIGLWGPPSISWVMTRGERRERRLRRLTLQQMLEDVTPRRETTSWEIPEAAAGQQGDLRTRIRRVVPRQRDLDSREQA